MKVLDKVYKSVLGTELKVVVGEYKTGNLYLGMITEDGEPYCDITVNLECVFGSDNLIAINHDFKWLNDSKLVEEVLTDVCGTFMFDYPQGFVNFLVWTINENVVNQL